MFYTMLFNFASVVVPVYTIYQAVMINIFKLKEMITFPKYHPAGLYFLEAIQHKFYILMLLSGMLICGVSMAYEELQQEPAPNDDAKLWRQRAYYSFWICDVMSRIIFGTVYYHWEHKFNAMSLLIFASISSIGGSSALLVVSIVNPEAGYLYPIPSVMYGIANGVFWMVGS